MRKTLQVIVQLITGRERIQKPTSVERQVAYAFARLTANGSSDGMLIQQCYFSGLYLSLNPKFKHDFSEADSGLVPRCPFHWTQNSRLFLPKDVAKPAPETSCLHYRMDDIIKVAMVDICMSVFGFGGSFPRD